MARPRFSLRWKIALLIAGLLFVVVAGVAVVTVYQPWRAHLAAQRHVALERVRPLSPTIVRLTSSGVSFRADVMRDLVLNSSSTPGQELLFALLYDDKGQLIESASVANTRLLGVLAPRLLATYRTDPARALAQLASRRRDVQRLAVTLKLEGNTAPVGWMLLGLVTDSIDAEASSELLRELVILGVGLALALLVATLLSRRLTRPLDDLSSAMGRLQKGEFASDLEVQSGARDEIGDLARTFNSMLQGLRERERLRGTLGRYVSGDVAEKILSARDDLSLRGETLHVAVLFLDVRGFSSLSELLTPQELVALLNDYFQVMVVAVTRRGGTVNKFIGDAALCIWGAPKHAKDPELSAVRAALEIQVGARALSESRVARGLPVVDFGIGINAGDALAGNLGAAERLEYTVIGDAVNLAQRLESQAKAGEVLVSESIYEKVSALVESEARAPVKVKGKSEPVPLWEVRGLKLGAALLSLVCLAMPLACERDQTGSSDELTITVRGDRRELEQQEKDLAQREQELRSQSDKLDARIEEAMKGAQEATSEARKRNASDELNRAREEKRQLDARAQSFAAEKSQVDAQKVAIERPLARASPAPVLASSDSSKLAEREAAVAAREAQVAAREKELAAREQAATDAERINAARAAEQKEKATAQAAAQVASREVPQLADIEQRHKRLHDDFAARGVLIADLPLEEQPLSAAIYAARRQGDLALASDLIAELASALKQVKVDQHFVEQKMARLNKQEHTAAQLTPAQKEQLEALNAEVGAGYTDGRYDAVNRSLNRVAAILDASAAPR